MSDQKASTSKDTSSLSESSADTSSQAQQPSESGQESKQQASSAPPKKVPVFYEYIFFIYNPSATHTPTMAKDFAREYGKLMCFDPHRHLKKFRKLCPEIADRLFKHEFEDTYKKAALMVMFFEGNELVEMFPDPKYFLRDDEYPIRPPAEAKHKTPFSIDLLTSPTAETFEEQVRHVIGHEPHIHVFTHPDIIKRSYSGNLDPNLIDKDRLALPDLLNLSDHVKCSTWRQDNPRRMLKKIMYIYEESLMSADEEGDSSDEEDRETKSVPILSAQKAGQESSAHAPATLNN